MNDVDPQAWLADVLAKLPDHPAKPRRRITPVELESPPASPQSKPPPPERSCPRYPAANTG